MPHACHRFWKCHKTRTLFSFLTRCTIPCSCHAKTTSELSKVVQACGVTWKCALRRSGMHFFDMSTSKSGPTLRCFVHFDFEMCFAPQRRPLFRHLNFQEWSDTEVFCTFWLRHVLRATTACTFSTSQLPKVLRSWGALYILTSKCAWRHNGVQVFISHLAKRLRTRRFSEPTFRPSGATNHWKNTVNPDFSTFRAPASSFFWLFLFSDLLSSLLYSSLLYSSLLVSSLLFSSLTLPTSACPSVNMVGSLTPKLPSTRLLSLGFAIFTKSIIAKTDPWITWSLVSKVLCGPRHQPRRMLPNLARAVGWEPQRWGQSWQIVMGPVDLITWVPSGKLT